MPSAIPQIEAVIRAIEALKPCPRFPADVLSQYRSALRNLAKRARHVEILNRRRDAQATIIKWQRTQGLRLAQTRDRNATLAWLLGIQDARLNVHAVAHGKRIAAKLGVQHYKTIGKLGAESRWKKHRERKALLCLEDAHV